MQKLNYLQALFPLLSQIKKHWPLIVLAIFLGIVCYSNFSPNTYLMGWDNLLPEFNLLLNIKRAFFSVWQNEALGFVTGNANAAELPRELLLLPLSFLPLNMVRQIYVLLMLGIGVFGSYFLIRSLVRYENRFLNRAVPLLGGLFYLFNLATIQTFYAPFEPFVTHFAFLPLLILSTLHFIAHRSSKSLLFFLIINFFAIPQAQVPTIFLVYLFSLCFFLLILIIETKRKEIIVSSVKVVVLTLLVNAFWILPFLFFVFHNSNVATSAKINQMSTETVFLQNKEFGDLKNVILLKGFWFNNVDPNSQGNFVYMLSPWRNYINSSIELAGYLFFLIILTGFIYVKWKKPFVLPFSALFILSFTMLVTNTPPFSWIDWVFRQIPGFSEIFRFPFTKFSILAALTYSFFFSIGVGKIISFIAQKFKTKKANLIIIPIILLFLIYMFPIFKGHLFYQKERVNFPSEYLQLFQYFRSISPTERIANFPQHTFWGWNYYDWEMGGSGFLWYGFSQPVLDRAFDVWSRESENYYWEISNALYLKDPLLFDNVIRKYNISYLLLDKSVLSVNSPKSLHISEFEEIVNQLSDIKKVKTFGKLNIYKVLGDNSALKTVNSTVNGYNWGDYDEAYNELGDYITSPNSSVVYPFRSLFSGKNEEDKEFRLQINDNSIDFISDKTKSTLKLPKIGTDLTLNSKIQNCDNFRKGEFSSKQIGGLLELSSKNATTCIFTIVTNILPSQGYLFTIDNKNIKGRPLHVWIVNEDASHTLIDTYLSEHKKLTTSYFVLPPQERSSKVYSFHFDNVSIGDEVQNLIGKVSLYQIPYKTLVSFKSKNSATGFSQVLVNNQAFDSGWKAYTVKRGKNFFKDFLPFISGKELKNHIMVNNWENGWVLDQTAQNEKNYFVIIYFPQYLEYLGFLALFCLILYLLHEHRSEKS